MRPRAGTAGKVDIPRIVAVRGMISFPQALADRCHTANKRVRNRLQRRYPGIETVSDAFAPGASAETVALICTVCLFSEDSE